MVVSLWHALKLNISSGKVARVGAGMNKWFKGCSLIFKPFTTIPTSPVSVFGMESSDQADWVSNEPLAVGCVGSPGEMYCIVISIIPFSHFDEFQYILV